MRKTIIIATTAFALLAAGEAMARCKKGQPCGNSCISWEKTCHK